MLFWGLDCCDGDFFGVVAMRQYFSQHSDLQSPQTPASCQNKCGFARSSGQKYHFIMNRRLDLAAERLRRGGPFCTITHVALDVGFNDLSHFSRAFRKRFGRPPLRYMASFRGSEPRF